MLIHCVWCLSLICKSFSDSAFKCGSCSVKDTSNLKVTDIQAVEYKSEVLPLCGPAHWA
jgi:hypothetical protein